MCFESCKHGSEGAHWMPTQVLEALVGHPTGELGVARGNRAADLLKVGERFGASRAPCRSRAKPPHVGDGVETGRAAPTGCET